MPTTEELKLTLDSLRTELASYNNKPYECLFEYIWNAFDAKATEVRLSFKVPKSGIGDVKNICIQDNGNGWDFKNQMNTNTFLSSSKQKEKTNNKTLPRGKYGRGRYVYIWIADYIEVFSVGQKLLLEQDTKVQKMNSIDAPSKGTKVCIHGPKEAFNNIFFNNELLVNMLIREYCWFLKENPSFSVIVNNVPLNYQANIKNELKMKKSDFELNIQRHLNDNFRLNAVIWNDQPSEWSSFFFVDEKGEEIFKKTTGMNKKRDSFWHTVYIKSDLFADARLDDDNVLLEELDFGEKERQSVKHEIVVIAKQKLVELRKPFLINQSSNRIMELKREKLLPNLHEYGIYDEGSYDDLLKTIYTIQPSLFVGRDQKEIKFICATFAGLLSTQDNNLVKIVLEQLSDLTESEKKDLLSILQRTSLANVVKTIKEIDNRLFVIESLQELLFTQEKKTLEVVHLQKALNENFWVFGEQFRLFSNTEGALKTTLYKYAKEILKHDDVEIITQSKKEVDFLLTKTLPDDNSTVRNVIVEIKRPSIELGKKQFDQIEEYADIITKESICNADNIYWEFYLIGNKYDDYIKTNKIDNAKNHGEKHRGLALNALDGRKKIYVRKWSDILQVEWGNKIKYLKNHLKITAQNIDNSNPDTIVNGLKP